VKLLSALDGFKARHHLTGPTPRSSFMDKVNFLVDALFCFRGVCLRERGGGGACVCVYALRDAGQIQLVTDCARSGMPQAPISSAAGTHGLAHTAWHTWFGTHGLAHTAWHTWPGSAACSCCCLTGGGGAGGPRAGSRDSMW